VAGRQLLTLFHRLLLVAAALCVVGWPRNWRESPAASAFQATLLVAAGIGAVWGFKSGEHPFFWLPLLVPLVAALPLPGRPSQGPVGWYLLGLLGATSLTHAVFFGDDRYHLIVTPALCLLAAAALRRVEPHRQPRQSGLAMNAPGRSTAKDG
jgi:hypothetical protein